jgi:hypothetical protein
MDIPNIVSRIHCLNPKAVGDYIKRNIAIAVRYYKPPSASNILPATRPKGCLQEDLFAAR